MVIKTNTPQKNQQTEGWTLASEHGGTRTYFQPVAPTPPASTGAEAAAASDEGQQGQQHEAHLVRVRVEGRVACSVMEQLAVIREADNYRRWMPLCLVNGCLGFVYPYPYVYVPVASQTNTPTPRTHTKTYKQQQDSRLVHREGNADQLVWFKLGVPGFFVFDVLLEAYGADLMIEGACCVGGLVTWLVNWLWG